MNIDTSYWFWINDEETRDYVSTSEYFTRTWQLILKYFHNQVDSYMNVMFFDYLMFCDFTETKILFLSYRIFECC